MDSEARTVLSATRHYENFTVVSFRQPRRIKNALKSIYAYCRTADDLADETSDSTAALQALDQFEQQFLKALEGRTLLRPAEPPVLKTLADTIAAFHLPPEPFRDLLTAFRQDQTIHRYHTFDEVLHYCQFSANPVGRIVLAVFGYRDSKFYPASDAICTGLQLANFWQDVARDALIGRIYIPLEDLERFGVSQRDIMERQFTQAFRDLMVFEVNRTQEWFERGRALTSLVGRNIRWEIEMFRRAGLSVLSGIRRVDYNVFRHRPKISAALKLWIAMTSLPVMLKRSASGR